jgi:K+-transporting ATPase ATPase B chain
MTKKKSNSLFESKQVKDALVQSFVKLNPKVMFKNPVMFTVETGTVIMFAVCIAILFGAHGQGSFIYNFIVFLILLATLLFANFAEAIAEARGKAQADSLRKTREETPAKKVLQLGKIFSDEIVMVSSSQLKKGDMFFCEAGDVIPTDGEIIEGIATIDESAITGESAPVIREAGGDKSSVTGGTKVLTDRITVKVTTEPGESFLDKMIALVEGASRQKTPNEIALTILLAAFTLIFVIVCVTLKPFADYANAPITIAAFISLFVCLIPTTIGGLLSAIGIAGMDRALRANVITKSGKAVETAGDIDVLLLDKTGTITIGNRKATNFYPTKGISSDDFIQLVVLSSLADTTPEGKSIVELAGNEVAQKLSVEEATLIKFTAETRTSGVILKDGTNIRKGAQDAAKNISEQAGNKYPEDTAQKVIEISSNGGTPLVVLKNSQVQGVIELQDIIKTGMKERFDRLRKMGVKTVMVTGDNPLTAKFIAEKAGVDDFIAEAKPEDKMDYIKAEQQLGKLVAMMGDGTNVLPLLPKPM